MRITFLIANVEGRAGGDKVIAQHARFLIDNGHDVTLVGNPPRKPGLTRSIRALLRGDTAPLSKLLTRARPKLGEHFEAEGVPVQRLARFRPITDADVPDADIVIGTWWETAEWMLKLSPEKGAKVHFVQGDDTISEYTKERAQEVFAAPCHKIAVSRWVSELLIKDFGIQKVWRADNTVDLLHFSVAPNELSPRHTALGFVVSTSQIKRTDLAVRAALALRNQFPNLQVRTFGTREYAPGRHVPDWFHHAEHPPQSEIPSLYQDCDIWLWTSQTEGFGLPILEAMACGVPVVATQAGAAPDILTPDCGILVPGEIDAIVEAVRSLLSNPDKLRDMKLAARARAEELCTPPSGAAFEKALNEILAFETYSTSVASHPKELSA